MKERLIAVMKRLNPLNRPITAAVSGGPDSMALLWLLRQAAPVCGFELTAAHYNHGLRGQESDRDEAFVKKVCQAWQIPCVAETGDVAAWAAQRRISVETAARERRYEFLMRVNRGYVATAHHADDQLETVLLHWCRGTGLDGLCGMSEQNGLLLRPLLSVTHGELLDLCRREGIEYVLDSTNQTDDCARNYLRHQAVPALTHLNDQLALCVQRTCQSLALDRAYLDEQTNAFLSAHQTKKGLFVDGFAALHPALQQRVALRWLQQNGFAYRHEIVTDLCRLLLSGTGCCEPVRGRRLRVEQGVLVEEQAVSPEDFGVRMQRQDASVLYQNGKIHKKFLKNAVDCDKIVGEVTLRTWQKGDSLTFSHRNVSKTLGRLFTEEHVPHALRRVWPVLCDEQGVIWAYAFGVDARVVADETTRQVLTVSSMEYSQWGKG